MSLAAEIARIRKQYFIWNKLPPRAATLNRELCAFFDGIKASLLIDGHLRAGPERFAKLSAAAEGAQYTGLALRKLKTALRTKAPAKVPASRCAPKPSRKKATRGKRRGRKATR